jgi:hypothetical protein
VTEDAVCIINLGDLEQNRTAFSVGAQSSSDATCLRRIDNTSSQVSRKSIWPFSLSKNPLPLSVY